jgi:LemA protein
MSTLELIAGAVIVIIVLAVVLVFNGLVSKRNRVQDAWAQIDVQLKRRYDLIPNLLEAVKGYMKYEKSVFTQVTALRSSIVSGSVQDKATANNMLSQTLKSIFAVAENYPDLKASENFKNLQEQLEDTEDKIAFVRTSYNDYVMEFNTAIQQLPGALFAGPFGFSKSDYFQAPDAEKQPVKVDFSDMDNAPAQAPSAPQQSPPKPKSPKRSKGGSD